MQSRTWEIIVEQYDQVNNVKFEIEDIRNKYLDKDTAIEYYCGILHDKDTKQDTGELKHPHYHVVIYYRKEISKKQVLNRVSDCLMCGKSIITVQEKYSLNSSVRYLTHEFELINVDNFRKTYKHVYPRTALFTSDVLETKRIYETNTNSKEMSIELFSEIVQQSHNIYEVYQRIGIANARLYRNIIQDLWREHLLEAEAAARTPL